MPAILSNATNFLLNSDFPLDKVVYLNTGSMSTAAGTTVTIPHGLPFVPLVGGSWSTDQTFATCYEFGSGTFPSGNIGYIFAVSLVIYSDATNIYITNNGITTTTAYYRIFALEPDDSNATLPSVATSGDSFLLDSDYNNRKLYTASNISFAASSTYTIDHNLGYYPQVLAWASYGVASYATSPTMNPIVASDDQDSFSSSVSMEVTTTSIIFRTGLLALTSTIYYRIYLDT